MSESQTSRKRMTVLIVEDDNSCAAYVEALVTKLDEVCVKADNTKDAIGFMGAAQFSGVICDLVLESGSGIEVAKVARSKNIPVVFATSADDDHNLNLMHEYGFVIRKPVRLNALARAIEYFRWAEKSN